LTTILKHL